MEEDPAVSLAAVTGPCAVYRMVRPAAQPGWNEDGRKNKGKKEVVWGEGGEGVLGSVRLLLANNFRSSKEITACP